MIKYVRGDLFQLIPKDRPIMITHVVNNVKKWGSGFVVPLGKNFPRAKEMYLKHFDVSVKIGQVQFVRTDYNVEEGNYVVVANMCAQSGIRSKDNERPLKYKHLISCMESVKMWAEDLNLEIHAPKFGSDRAGGNWDLVHELMEEVWAGIDITIYEL